MQHVIQSVIAMTALHRRNILRLLHYTDSKAVARAVTANLAYIAVSKIKAAAAVVNLLLGTAQGRRQLFHILRRHVNHMIGQSHSCF